LNQNLEILIGKLQQVKPDIEVLDVADTLWLSQYVFLDKIETISESNNHTKQENENKEEITTKDRSYEENNNQEIDDNENELEDNQDNIAENSSNFSFDKQTDTSKSIKLKEKKKERLFDLKIARQLKPLKRKINSQNKMSLDINKTVDFIAQTGVYQAILNPKESKEFSLSIVIDQGLSMFLWEELIEDFKKSILNCGIFDKINFYYLSTDEQKAKLFADKNQNIYKNHKIAELNHKRNITFILSDCVSLAWRSNSVYDDFINFWTKYSFVAILQVLPPRMWKRTPLNRGYQVNFKTNSFLTPLNSSLDIDLGFVKRKVNKETLKIPIMYFDNYSFEYISKIITSTPNIWISGVVLNSFKFQEFFEEEEEILTAQKRIEYFFSVASPQAQELAIYCSVLPLTIGIIKEVQKIKNLEQDITYIAEFYFGKLLKKSEVLGEFDFHDGVRELLRVNVNATDAFELSNGLSDFMKESLGTSIGFHDLLYENIGESELSDKDRELVNIFLDTFLRKGGRYLAKYKRITENLDRASKDNFIIKSIKRNEDKLSKLLFLYSDNKVKYNKILLKIEKTFQKQGWYVDIDFLESEYAFEKKLNKYKNINIHDCIFYYVGNINLGKQEKLFLESDTQKVSFVNRLKKIYSMFNNCNIAGIIDTCSTNSIRLNNINGDIELLISHSLEKDRLYQYKFSYDFCEAMNSSVDIITLQYIREYINRRQDIGSYVLDIYNKKDYTKNIILVDKTGSEQTLFKYRSELINRVYKKTLLEKIPKALITLGRENHLVKYLENIIDYLINYLQTNYPKWIDNIETDTIKNISQDREIELIMSAIRILSVNIAKETFKDEFIDKLYDYIYAPAKHGDFDEQPLLYSFNCISFLLPKHNEWLFDYLKKVHFYLENFFKSQASLEFDHTGRIRVHIFIEIIDNLIKTNLKIKEIPFWIFEFIERLKKVATSEALLSIKQERYFRINYLDINKEQTLKEAFYENNKFTKKYKAFLCCSHADEEFGSWLHKQLEKYKIPKKLREDYPNLPKSLYPIFRDLYELKAGDDLGKEIYKALENSNALIVVCSTKSANSKWVNKEIIDFKMMHGEDRIFPIIVDGEPFAKESDKFEDSLECFPEALKYKVDSEGNLTSERTSILASSMNDGHELAILKLIAGILGVPFGEIYQRNKEKPFWEKGFNVLKNIFGIEENLRYKDESLFKKKKEIESIEDDFLIEVFDKLKVNKLVALLYQDLTDITDYQNKIQNIAKSKFYNGFYYIEIPKNIDNESIFFQQIAENFNFHKQVKSANQFKKNMSLKLKESEKILLLITGIDEGNEVLIKKFSMIIRVLSENFSNIYSIFIGQKFLAQLCYSQLELSYLNIATTIFFPNIKIDLDREYIVSILSLLEEYREIMCELIRKEKLGKSFHFFYDEIRNQLFWKNLLINIDGELFWRDNVTEIANEILPCKNNLYQLYGGVKNKLQFFGRKNLIQTMLSTNNNYMIVGARTLGKSYMLKELKRQYSNFKEIECIYLTLIDENILSKLSHSLNISDSSTLDNIIQAILEYDKKLIFLIEEAEKLIKYDRNHNYEIIKAFRILSQKGKATFIFTGFIELYKEVTFNYLSPLKNFAKLIELRGLEDSACRDLMVEPMKQIDVSYENDNLVTYVIEQCGNHPAYITQVCHTILQQLDSRNIIQKEDINNALEKFKSNFNILPIYIDNNDLINSLARIIIYLTLKKENFNLKEIVELLRTKGIDIEIFKIENTLNLMVVSYILNRKNSIYSYAVPLIREILLEENEINSLIDVEVYKLKK